FLVTLSALLVMTCMSAEAQIRTQASLSGYVSDPSGAMIPGATVRAINVQTNVANVATANSSGYYYVPALNAGTYKIEASAKGCCRPAAISEPGRFAGARRRGPV
ncbi:MAG: carboxypeptidase-like regulatory domain-containing protein, partial [Terriglobia bacterium]